jgi:hypothetical protein
VGGCSHERGRAAGAPNPAAVEPIDKRRFVACLIGGQSAAVLAVLVFGGILMPALLAFVGSGAGLLLGSPERSAHLE